MPSVTTEDKFNILLLKMALAAMDTTTVPPALMVLWLNILRLPRVRYMLCTVLRFMLVA